MKKRQLGQTAIKISPLAYGSWALGKKGWGNVDEQEAFRTLDLAIEKGINFIDTAPVYGFGRSEENLGKALQHKRQQVVLASKCGLVVNNRGQVEHNLSPASIEQQLTESLKRLQTDYLDLYQIHWPDKQTPLAETFSCLERLQKQGKILHLGVCNFSLPLLKEALQYNQIASLQNCFNLLEQPTPEIFTFCQQEQISFLSYSPFAQGLLAGNFSDTVRPGKRDIRRLNPLYQNEEKYQQALSRQQSLGLKPAEKSLEFIFAEKAVSAVLISMTKRKHLLENLKIIEKLT